MLYNGNSRSKMDDLEIPHISGNLHIHHSNTSVIGDRPDRAVPLSVASLGTALGAESVPPGSGGGGH